MAATARRDLTVVILATGANVWSKSRPGICRHPRMTNLALFLSNDPSEWFLVLYNHFVPIAFLPGGKSVMCQVSLSYRAVNSSFIADTQQVCWAASLKDVGSLDLVGGVPKLRFYCIFGGAHYSAIDKSKILFGLQRNLHRSTPRSIISGFGEFSDSNSMRSIRRMEIQRIRYIYIW